MTLAHLVTGSVDVLCQAATSTVGKDRDSHWEELQPTEEHTERPQLAHSKFYVHTHIEASKNVTFLQSEIKKRMAFI